MPVDTFAVRDFTLLDGLSDSSLAQNLKRCASDSAELDRLSKRYGTMPIGVAKDLLARKVEAGYTDIEMLGFKFSQTWFWVFLAVLNILFLVCSIAHGRQPFQGDPDELHTFHLRALLTYPAARLVFWIIVPTVAMLLAYPSTTDAGSLLQLTYWLAFVVVLLIAIIGFSTTRKYFECSLASD